MDERLTGLVFARLHLGQTLCSGRRLHDPDCFSSFINGVSHPPARSTMALGTAAPDRCPHRLLLHDEIRGNAGNNNLLIFKLQSRPPQPLVPARVLSLAQCSLTSSSKPSRLGSK